MGNPDIEVPDFFAPAYGFKVLRFILDGETLASPYYTNVKWPTKANKPVVAECGSAYFSPLRMAATGLKHDSPSDDDEHMDMGMGCGIYAHYRLEPLIRREKPRMLVEVSGVAYGCLVIAVMEGWGRMRAHQSVADGWRAQYARIAALCRPYIDPETPPKSKRIYNTLGRIADSLRVPYVEVEEAEAFGKSWGVSLCPSDVPPEV